MILIYWLRRETDDAMGQTQHHAVEFLVYLKSAFCIQS